MKELLKQSKKGQLFLLEVFIALSVLILLMIAIYQVEFTTVPTYHDDLSTLGHESLHTLNEANVLKPLVYNMQTLELAEILETTLPENVYWRLSVKDGTGVTLFTIYENRTPPLEASIGVTDYILYGHETHLNQFRIIHMELWRLAG